MAKGFTVKATAPRASAPTEDWDYGAIKERMKGKSIVFCLPGEDALLYFSRHLYNFVLILYKME